MKNTITTAKRAKRPYIKKRLRTQDELWKAIVPRLWGPFIRFCMVDWVDKIDFTRKPDFLDKELKRLALRAKSKNRTVDFLMRIYLKDGTTKFFLLHIEVQGYPDPEFRKRIFQYYYRISDVLQEDVETLVIMIDDDPNWRPDEYIHKFGQTKVHFMYRMFKLLDNPPPYTDKEDNPFSVVFEVAWYALKKNMFKNDADLATLKFRLIKRLLETNTETEVIYDILEFINIYLPFKKSEKTTTFDREIELIIDNDKDMGAKARTIREIYEEFLSENHRKIARKEARKEIRVEMRASKKQLEKTEMLRQEAVRMGEEALRMGEEEARMRQEEVRMRQEEVRKREEEARMRQEAEVQIAALVRKLFTQGASVQSIADTISKPVAFVQDLIEKK